MRDNNSPKPIFETDEDRTYFIVELPINEMFLEYNKAQDKPQDKAQDKRMQVVDETLSEIELKIIEILEKEHMNKTDISQQLGYKSTPGNVKRAIRNLLERQYIIYTIPDKPTSRNQKYKLKR